MQYVKIPDEKTNYQKLYDIAAEAGIEDPDIQISTGTIDSVSVDLLHDRSGEVQDMLRRGRHIL
jgi:hypothetical protein